MHTFIESKEQTRNGAAVPEYALAIDGLSFNYAEKKALDSVSLSIKPGECAILLGPNGAGKTTLFSLICGLFAATEGSIDINGFNARSQSSKALASLGIVFQSQTLDLDLSVSQNLHYFCALQGLDKRSAKQRIEAGASQLQLHDRLSDKVRTLNGGHRRRVEILRSTLHQPSVLLLDEPTVGLDIPTRNQLVEQLHQLPVQTNAAVLWATHLVDEIRPEDRVIILHNGRCVADDSSDRIVKHLGVASLEEAFAKLTKQDLNQGA
jgi:ABC-2 type transport system ATP-binding protein